MLNDRDHVFATDVLNASLTLMSILVAVITLLAVEYKGVQTDPIIAEPIRTAVIGATAVSFFAGVLALAALIYLRLGRWSIAPLVWAFAVLIVIMTMGIVYVENALMA
jgi:hypothetical protein